MNPTNIDMGKISNIIFFDTIMGVANMRYANS